MRHLFITAASHTGCVRSKNEDMVLVGDWCARNAKVRKFVTLEKTDRYLCSVADGMGGYSGGDIASNEVLKNLQFFYSDIPTGLSDEEFRKLFDDWLRSISIQISSQGLSNKECSDMGTTLVAFAYYQGQFYWINCGDSRLYLLHDGHLQQLTTDHTLNSAQHSGYVTNCIGGGNKHSYIDMENFTKLFHDGDTLLLCSDGLSEMVNEESIAQLLNDGFDADALCMAAEDAGGIDNVSAIVIRTQDI